MIKYNSSLCFKIPQGHYLYLKKIFLSIYYHLNYKPAPTVEKEIFHLLFAHQAVSDPYFTVSQLEKNILEVGHWKIRKSPKDKLIKKVS